MVVDGIFSHQTPMPANNRGLRRLAGRYRLKDRLWELNCGILGLGLSVMLAFTITGMRSGRSDGIHVSDAVYRSFEECDWQTATRYH